MKKILMVFVLGLMCQPVAAAETYSVNTNDSGVVWKASKVTGQHNGRVDLASGEIEFEDGRLTGGEAVIDMTSIAVEDIKDPGNNLKLTNHLKSADFFDVKNHPEARMEVTGVEPAGDGTYTVTADFTIRGITHPVTFSSQAKETEVGAAAEAEITIDRTLYNVRYGSGKFFEDLGDKMIHDDFKLTVLIEAE